VTPGALHELADTHEETAPGLAAVLREWALCLQHDDALSVAKEALAALDRAEQLALVVPEDTAHRTAIGVLTNVLISVSREVFRRDARRLSHG
jgi:hypothetical protein